MISKEFSSVLKIISSKLEKNKINWAMIGSSNMALKGMEVTPRDLDIVVNLEDLKKLSQIFKDKNIKIEPWKPLRDKPAWKVQIKLNKVEVEFLGEKPDGEYLRELKKENIDYIDLDNIKIPCFKLETDAKVYARTGRQNKADLIFKFLKQKSKLPLTL